MAHPSEPRDPATALDTLRALLDAASTMAADLAGKVDPFVTRLMALFDRMPADDREPMLGILEREVGLRVLSRTNGKSEVGLEIGRPDPNARIYVRVWEPARTFQTDDDLLRAVVRGIRLVLQSPERMQADVWRAAAEGFGLLEPPQRRTLIKYLRELLAVVERMQDGVSAEAS